MTRMLGFAAFAVVVGGSAALAQSSPASVLPERQPMSEQDRQFLSYAAEDNQAEIALCLLAEKKAPSPAVKAFARLMIDDHVEIESRLAAVANAEQADFPEGVGADGQKTHDKLRPLTGSAYEAAFLQAQIEDHENDLKKFAHQVATTKNETLRQFASETGPLLEQHLALARAVQTATKAK